MHIDTILLMKYERLELTMIFNLSFSRSNETEKRTCAALLNPTCLNFVSTNAKQFLPTYVRKIYNFMRFCIYYISVIHDI